MHLLLMVDEILCMVVLALLDIPIDFVMTFMMVVGACKF